MKVEIRNKPQDGTLAFNQMKPGRIGYLRTSGNALVLRHREGAVCLENPLLHWSEATIMGPLADRRVELLPLNSIVLLTQEE